ncbi:aldo/keto reductase [Actinophytocola xinjiangensis]|uniref:Aldo/keto reductase n=1 Tax=Actinophytocola xinjiangensis TaxID=485602 RepID=A0A7Z0WTV1_9PSEU|nr:aldo/keto reductase [Actinophytocola xinjiangensis]OLF13641.1 aldo/keto reductase [Actinophytocola xinjiangensis]
MITHELGRHGLTVSAIGLGCMGMSQDYGPADDEESVRVIQCAADLGVTLIDTSMSYGAGHNEELVGRAVADRRDDVVLATKFGIWRENRGDPPSLDARPERIRGFCEDSLKRLRTDHIDLYYLHRVDPTVPVEDSVGAMAELVAEGKVRYLGLSESSTDELKRAANTAPISAVQYEWSLFWRELEDDTLPLARDLGIGVVGFSPLGRGYLTGRLKLDELGEDDDRRPDQRFHGEHLAANDNGLAQLKRMAAERDITPGQLALAWLLAQGDDVVAIPGTRDRTRLAENVAAADVSLSTADLAHLEAVVPRSAWSGDRFSYAVPRTSRR